MTKTKKKKNNDLILFLNSSLSFTPNYNDIKPKINEEQFIKKTNTKVDLFKYSKLSLYTFLICIISVFTTIIVKDSTSSSSTGNINSGNIISDGVPPGDIYPGKDPREWLEKNFDNFFAFGPGGPSGLFSFDLIMKTNLISDTDKEILKNYKNENPSSQFFCNIHLGEKNGIDIVTIHQLCRPYKGFTFNSNLDYSFKDVLESFEEQCQKKIEKEFLYGSDNDHVLGNETSGIILEFKKVGDLYVPYYTMLLDGIVYIVNK